MPGIKNRGSQIQRNRTKYKRNKMETEEVLLEEDIQEEVEERAEPVEILYRDFQVESGNKETRTVEMSVSSEAPVERMWAGVTGLEILDHSPDSINLKRFDNGSAPLLMDHDPTKQIGVIDSIRLDQSQRKLRASAGLPSKTFGSSPVTIV